MQIQNSSSLNLLGNTQNNIQNTLRKLSTGKAISTAADEPSMIAQAQELESQVRGFKQSDVNIGDAIGAMNTADATGSSVTDLMQSQRDLALQANNGTMNADQRQILNDQYQQYSQEITRESKAANFNGQGVADGSSPLSNGTGQIQSGPGANDQTPLSKIDFSAAANTGSIDTSAGAMSALKSLDQGIKDVTSTRAQIGSETNVLSAQQANVNNQNINTSAALSNTQDLDFAQGAMDLSQNLLQNQTATQAQGAFGDMSRNNVQALLAS